MTVFSHRVTEHRIIAGLAVMMGALALLTRIVWADEKIWGFPAGALLALLALTLLAGLVGHGGEEEVPAAKDTRSPRQNTHSYSNLNRTAPFSVELVRPKR